ncbi:GerAB/ArcD/ProY family transporter [Paenibacillus oryzisoli]|uniref:GerAB/ArcD/ProY family transporter n=1 Tax=Paenibacillus oryzisoli TaxID=1850517 RepID=UPI003D2824E9
MNNQGTVTSMQLGGLIFVFVFSTTIAFLLSPLAGIASFDGGLCMLLSAIGGTAITTLGMRFAMRLPTQYVGVYGGRLLPKFVHKAVLLLVAIFYLHLSAFILREFTDFFMPIYLRETPPVAVAILVMVPVVALTQSGVAFVFRFAQGCFLVIGGLFAFKPLFFVNAMDSPMWHEFIRIHDWKVIWQQTYTLIPWYGELIMLAYIAPQFNPVKNIRKIIWLGSMAGTYILIMEFLMMMFFFGPKLSAALVYPALELTGFMHLGDFLHNIDALIVSIWFTGFFIKLAIIFNLGTLIFSQALSLRNHKTITFPLAAMVISISLILAKNPIELSEDFNSSWSSYALCMEVLFFLYPLAAWVKGKKRRSAALASDTSAEPRLP